MTFLYASKKLYAGLRISLGLIFLISGIIKITDLEAFSKVIQVYGILPYGFSYPMAVMICFCEIIFGAGLMADIKGSLSAVFLMLVTFMSVLSYALFKGYNVDCGCFGPEDIESRVFPGMKGALLRDFLMAGLTLYLYQWRYKNRHLPFSFNSFIKHRRKV
jgi:uncharacterized membrane protein YphA (DoxX/SURF4 family)